MEHRENVWVIMVAIKFSKVGPLYLGRDTRYPMTGVVYQKEHSLLSNLRRVAVILDRGLLKKI